MIDLWLNGDLAAEFDYKAVFGDFAIKIAMYRNINEYRYSLLPAATKTMHLTILLISC